VASVNADRDSRPSTSYTDYHVKKRKLRSQVEDSNSSSSAGGSGGGNGAGSSSGANNGALGVSQAQTDLNKNTGASGSGSGTEGSRPVTEPLNDIEKYLNIRRQVA
jgi:hypothetical protein